MRLSLLILLVLSQSKHSNLAVHKPCANGEIGLGISQWEGRYIRAMIFTDDCLGWSMSKNHRHCLGGREVGVRIEPHNGAPSIVELPREKFSKYRDLGGQSSRHHFLLLSEIRSEEDFEDTYGVNIDEKGNIEDAKKYLTTS